MIRVLVVDDEPLARDELSYLLGRQDGVQVVGAVGDGAAALEIVRREEPDVVFMDIELHGENGLEVARRFLTLPRPPRVVFATAYDQYALEAFAVKALDYIVKPFTEVRVAEAVERLREAGPPARVPAGTTPRFASPPSAPRVRRIAVEENERIILLDPDDIIFATREDRSTVIRTAGRAYRTGQSLQELEARLGDDAFFRPHRGFLVNLRHVAEIHPWFNGAYELVMADQERTRVPVSRQAARRLRELLQF